MVVFLSSMEGLNVLVLTYIINKKKNKSKLFESCFVSTHVPGRWKENARGNEARLFGRTGLRAEIRAAPDRRLVFPRPFQRPTAFCVYSRKQRKIIIIFFNLKMMRLREPSSS